MGKHALEKNKKQEEAKKHDEDFYGRIIARQGEGLVEAERKYKELENRLVQERVDRIEDLRNIKVLATCNHCNNDKVFLNKIAEIVEDKLKELTNVATNAKRKELSSHTDQSI